MQIYDPQIDVMQSYMFSFLGDLMLRARSFLEYLILLDVWSSSTKCKSSFLSIYN